MMKTIENQIKEIAKEWFLKEPLLFSAFCSHSLIENSTLNIPFRTGKMRIEYSSEILAAFDRNLIENLLKVEMYRILLQHPYSRQPYNVRAGILAISSDVTIYNLLEEKQNLADYMPGILYLKNQAVRFHTLEHPLGIKWTGSEELKFFQRNLQIDRKTGELLCVDKLSFEQWYSKILFLVKETAIAGENAGQGENENGLAQMSELWEENEEAQQQIKNNLEKAEISEGWGGLGGELQRSLKDECDFSFDYRRALTQFRQSIVSASRSLTRMRPSRRYGFKAMGSRYERKANVLIAVDVSGSITDESFNHFTHAIKNFFFLGLIEKIDLIFFDVNLKNTTPVTFRKKVDIEEIKGRGGTNFQPAIDFFEEHKSEYSGLIIFTDAEGNPPVIKAGHNNILWILDSRIAFEKNHQWINSLNGCKVTYLPF